MTDDLKPLACPFCGRPAICDHGYGMVRYTCSKDDGEDCPSHMWVSLEVWNRRAALGRSSSPPTVASGVLSLLDLVEVLRANQTRAYSMTDGELFTMASAIHAAAVSLPAPHSVPSHKCPHGVLVCEECADCAREGEESYLRGMIP